MDWRSWGAEAWPLFKVGEPLGFRSAGTLPSAPDSCEQEQEVWQNKVFRKCDNEVQLSV